MVRFVAALSAVVLGVIGTTGVVHAADEPWLSRGEKGTTVGDTTIEFAGTDKCLDAAAEEIGDNGGKVQLWTCDPEGDEQFWFFERHDEWGGVVIRNRANGKCLEVALEEIDIEGGRLQMWDCTGSIEQLWTVWTHSGDLFLKSKATGGDRFGAPSLTDGAPVGLYHW